MEGLREQITAKPMTAILEVGQPIQKFVPRLERAESAKQETPARGARFANKLKVALERRQQ